MQTEVSLLGTDLEESTPHLTIVAEEAPCFLIVGDTY